MTTPGAKAQTTVASQPAISCNAAGGAWGAQAQGARRRASAHAALTLSAHRAHHPRLPGVLRRAPRLPRPAAPDVRPPGTVNAARHTSPQEDAGRRRSTRVEDAARRRETMYGRGTAWLLGLLGLVGAALVLAGCEVRVGAATPVAGAPGPGSTPVATLVATPVATPGATAPASATGAATPGATGTPGGTARVGRRPPGRRRRSRRRQVRRRSPWTPRGCTTWCARRW